MPQLEGAICFHPSLDPVLRTDTAPRRRLRSTFHFLKWGRELILEYSHYSATLAVFPTIETA
jgi:hypothetical protein